MMIGFFDRGNERKTCGWPIEAARYQMPTPAFQPSLALLTSSNSGKKKCVPEQRIQPRREENVWGREEVGTGCLKRG